MMFEPISQPDPQSVHTRPSAELPILVEDIAPWRGTKGLDLAGKRRPLRVLHLLETLGRGGAERNLVNVLSQLPKGEHAVCYLHPPDDYHNDLIAAGIPVRCLGFHRKRDLGQVLLSLREELLRGDYQLLFTQVWLADIVGRLSATMAHVPVISALQTSAYAPDTLATYSLQGRIKSMLWNRPLDVLTARLFLSRLVAVSHFVGQQAVHRLHVPPKRVVVIPNSVDTKRFSPPSLETRRRLRNELNLPAKSKVLVTVGKLNKGKGNDILLGAMPSVLRKYPDTLLLILGYGSDGPQLQRLAERMAISHAVRFLGQRPDVERFLCAADIFVFASRYEGLPLCVLEAMATGLPCVLSGIPPHREVSDEGEVAYLLPPNPLAWSEAILDLLSHPDKAASMGRRGLARVTEHYNARVVAEALQEVFSTEAREDPWEQMDQRPWGSLLGQIGRLPVSQMLSASGILQSGSGGLL